MTILVTGGAGYIGSHMVHALTDAGEDVVVLDNLSTGYQSLLPKAAAFVNGDTGDSPLVGRVLREFGVETIMHFAAAIVVPESVRMPLQYYRNNTLNTCSLIESAVAAGVDNFIFSSTAAVYGMPSESSVHEEVPKTPISPYGWSKLMSEQILGDAARAHGLNFVILRYFNVAGADPDGRTGQSTPRATHLIKVACETALGKRKQMTIFGSDYGTPDGTCIRDYIHILDLAQAHILALNVEKSAFYNLGTGGGTSVREIIAACERVTGKKIAVVEKPRRAGDPPLLIAASDKIKKELGWEPKFQSIDKIVESAWAWHVKNPLGYQD